MEDKGPSSLSSCKLITTAEEHYRAFLIKETQESFFCTRVNLILPTIFSGLFSGN